MRLPLIGLAVMASCSDGMTAGPMFFPTTEQGSAATDPGDQQRRGAVEIAVKNGYPAILEDIMAGGGPFLTGAMDAANVPPADRPARIIQLSSVIALYEASPGALVSALMVYGGATP